MKYDRLLDQLYFPGPQTPQVPQNRVRQTYRGLSGCADCKLPPVSLGALPAGAFAGAIAMLAGTKDRRPTPGTMTASIAESAGLSKGGGGGQHHGGGGHHHGGRGRGGAWFGYPGWYGGDTTYVYENTNPCPYGYLWDAEKLRCTPIPVGLKGLGSTATDWCTALRTGSAVAGHDADPTTTPPTPATGMFVVCNQITDATSKELCKAAVRAAQVGISSGCAHVDDPTGGTLPSIDTMKQAQSFASAMNHVDTAGYFQPPAKSFTDTTAGKAVVYGGIAVAGLAAAALLLKVLK